MRHCKQPDWTSWSVWSHFIWENPWYYWKSLCSLWSTYGDSPSDPGLTRKHVTARRSSRHQRWKSPGCALMLGSRGCLQKLDFLHLITMPIPICLLVTPASPLTATEAALPRCQESLYFRLLWSFFACIGNEMLAFGERRVWRWCPLDLINSVSRESERESCPRLKIEAL